MRPPHQCSVSLQELLLREPKLTLAAAESLTCGRVQSLIGSVSGSSAYFLGGITAYSLDQKVAHLGVDRRAARVVNSVSAEVAAQMARGVVELFGSHLGVATTGYAEPVPSAGVRDPHAWWAIAYRRSPRARFEMRSGRVECPGAGRVEAQSLVAEAVLTELVAFVRELRGAPQRSRPRSR